MTTSAKIISGLLFLLAAPLFEQQLALMIFDRPAIASGQLWRLWTGHWIHFTWFHWALNGAGLLLYLLLLGRYTTSAGFAVRSMLLASTLSLALWLASPLKFYAGFSGVLTGLFMFGSLTAMADGTTRHDRLTGLAIILIIGVKVSYGLLFPEVSLPSYSHLLGAPKAEFAHQVGAVAALGYFVVYQIFQKRGGKSRPSKH